MRLLLPLLLMLSFSVRAAVTPAVQNDSTTKHVVQPPGFWPAQLTDPAAVAFVRGAQTNGAGGGGSITGAVASVNGHQGIVVLSTTDIQEAVNLYWTAARILAATNGFIKLPAAQGVTNNIGSLVNLKSRTSINADAAATLTTATGLTNGLIPPARYGDSGANSVALGQTAHATGSGGVSVGHGANTGSASGSVAIGESSDAENGLSTAIGHAANATFGSDTAIGYNASTDKPHQIKIGTSAEEVRIPGSLFVDGIITGNGAGLTNVTGTGGGSGDVLKAGTNVMTGSNAYTGPTRFVGDVLMDSFDGFGYVTFHHSVTTNASSTNSIYTLGSENSLENGTFYLASPFDVSGSGDFVPCWTNVTGAAILQDVLSVSYQNFWTMVATTNGPDPANLPLFASLGTFQPQGAWSSQNSRLAPTSSGWGSFSPSTVFANPPIGSGAQLTNISAMNIHGNLNNISNLVVTGPGFFSGSITGQSLTVMADIDGTNIYGNGAALYGVSSHGPAIWRTLPTPPMMITTYGINNLSVGGPTEQTVTNIIRVYKTNGVLAAWQAVGIKPWIHLDVGWIFTTRDVNGLIWWRTNQFPNGLPWLKNYANTNGFNLEGSIYFADKFIVTGGAPFDPVMTLSTIGQDVTQFYKWFDGIRASDGQGNNFARYQNTFARALADAVMFPSNIPALTTNGHLLMIDMATHDRFTGELPWYVNNRWSDQGFGSGNDFSKKYPQLTISLNGDGGAGAGNSGAVYWMTGPGHYVNHVAWIDSVDGQTVVDFRFGLAAAGMMPGQMQYDLTNASASLVLHYTNATFLKIQQDPLCLPPAVVSDEGETGLSMFQRKLTNGYAILMRNGSNAAAPMTINWTQIRSPDSWFTIDSGQAERWSLASGTSVSVDHVFGTGGMATNCGTFTGSFTATVASRSSEWFLFTPQPSSGGSGNGFPLTSNVTAAGFSISDLNNVQGTGTVTTAGLKITGGPGFTNGLDGLIVTNAAAIGGNFFVTGGQTNAGTVNASEFVGNGAKLTGLTGISASALPYRAGTTNIGNLATSLLITFTSAMSDANYAVSVTFDTTLGAAVSAAATSKTAAGFTLTLSAGIAGGANLDYTAWPYR